MIRFHTFKVFALISTIAGISESQGTRNFRQCAGNRSSGNDPPALLRAVRHNADANKIKPSPLTIIEHLAMFAVQIGLRRLTRRTLLAMTALAVSQSRALTQTSSGDMLTEIVALATAPETMALDVNSVLQRLAFRGGTPKGHTEATRAIWDLRDGPLTLGHIELSRGTNGWRVDMVTLLFTDDDEILLPPLRNAFTKRFGAPVDETMGPGSNTVLRWRGTDRSVRVTADVPGDAHMHVYAVRIGK